MSLRKRLKKKTTKKKPARHDWEMNQEAISQSFWKLATVPGKLKMPTILEIAEDTGLNRKTIERHLEFLDLKKHMQKLRCVEDKMLIVFMNKVMKSNNDKMWDLYFSVTNPNFSRKTTSESKVDLTSGGKPITLPTVILPGEADAS